MRSGTPSVSLALFVLAACTTGPSDDGLMISGTGTPAESSTGTPLDPTTSGIAPSTSMGTGNDTTATGGTADSTGGILLDVGPEETEGTVPEIAEVFGHSGNTLYRLDPDTNEVEIVADFVGCDPGSVIDIALDADSQMYGTGFSRLWSIDRMTGQCTEIAQGSYPTSLSFVPAGTVDPLVEALVGFVDEQYIRIDVNTGAVTDLGTLPGGLQSSGDMVSVIGGGSYLTVRGPGCDLTDCLIEIDPVDGSVIQDFGPLPYDEVFGLAFWAGSAYGFAREGVLFEIDLEGPGLTITEIPIPVAPPGLEFFGAGSTTSAPPVAG